MENTFADRVRAARKALKLTQAALGVKAGLSQTTIGDIERGRNDSCTEIVKLAKALQRSPDYLLYGTDDSGAQPQAVQLTPEQKELLEIWSFLLPEEQESVMEKIKERAKHNQAVLSKLVTPALPMDIQTRTIVVSERRKSNRPFQHQERRKAEDGG